MRAQIKWHIALALTTRLLISGCDKKEFDDSAYVLIRNSTVNNSTPALRAYFVGEGAAIEWR